MILVDHELKKLCSENQLVTPYDESLVNPSSIDLRLGKTILLDCKEGFKEYDITGYTKEKPFRLKPLSFCLAQTLETVKIPECNTSWLHLKSSRAREGLSHSLAGWIENGFNGVVTFELFNLRSKVFVPLYYGQKIAQLVVGETKKPSSVYNGKYQNATTVEASKDV